jgi:hypothetical protein
LFSSEPALLGSAPRIAPQDLVFSALEDTCQAEDLLVLATDAVAAWALKQLEAGRPLGLESLWEFGQDDYVRWIERLRQEQQIRYDDSTVMLLRLSAAPSPSSLDAAGGRIGEPLAQVGTWARRWWPAPGSPAE